MNIIKIIIFISLGAIIHASSQIDGHDIIENKVVIKFEDSFSPKVGKENSITIDQVQSLSDIFKNLNIIEFRPLFIKNQNFGEIEYKYSLHQYYVLETDSKIEWTDRFFIQPRTPSPPIRKTENAQGEKQKQPRQDPFSL